MVRVYSLFCIKNREFNSNYNGEENDSMELNYFKDKLFDLLNDSENMEIFDIDVDEKTNMFTIATVDGSVFKIECMQKEK